LVADVLDSGAAAVVQVIAVVLPRAGEPWTDGVRRVTVRGTMILRGVVRVGFTEEPLLIFREWTLVTFLRRYKPEGDFVRFGDIARGRLGEQAQYASRYIDGRLDYPNLGKGLRFEGDPSDYHDVRIHKADVEEFVRRWQEHKEQR
jgi:hypothetical protein